MPFLWSFLFTKTFSLLAYWKRFEILPSSEQFQVYSPRKRSFLFSSMYISLIIILHLFSEVHGGEVMRINMCVAIMIMQSVFLIGAHVKAQQVIKDVSRLKWKWSRRKGQYLSYQRIKDDSVFSYWPFSALTKSKKLKKYPDILIVKIQRPKSPLWICLAAWPSLISFRLNWRETREAGRVGGLQDYYAMPNVNFTDIATSTDNQTHFPFSDRNSHFALRYQIFQYCLICRLRKQLTFCDFTTGEMTSGKWVQKFHADNKSLPRSE